MSLPSDCAPSLGVRKDETIHVFSCPLRNSPQTTCSYKRSGRPRNVASHKDHSRLLSPLGMRLRSPLVQRLLWRRVVVHVGSRMAR